MCSTCSKLKAKIQNATESKLSIRSCWVGIVLLSCYIAFQCFPSFSFFIAKDFRAQIKWSDMLLAHFTMQWRDRMTYWLARQRSRSVKDMLTCIIDSYDKAKIMLPKFLNSRTPKSVIYETVRRTMSLY